MYWAYTTMTTVGYGDIFATTVAEKARARRAWPLGVFVLAPGGTTAAEAPPHTHTEGGAQRSAVRVLRCLVASPQVWAMITMVIGGFFLSFCFGRIASIVGRLDADRAARAEQIESITQFLKDYELPKPISKK